ncbi:MAG: SpoIIE family protein phosphatase [Candidatus Kapabacteria bacterium]|nr:SpoIIE family protein phosphatase [Candidatus Kapabacteria bacterium]
MKTLNSLSRTRILIASFFAFYIIIILIAFFKISSSTTDENQWIDLPSKFYLTKDIKGEISDPNSEINKSISPAFNLILSVDDVIPENISDFEKIIQKSNNKQLTLRILDISEFKIFNYIIDKNDFDKSAIRIIDSAVIIRNVFKDGASDRAGLKVGDIITSINNKKFSNSMEADKILREGEIGKTLDYHIIRDGKDIEIKVFLAKFGISFEYFILILTGLSYIIFGFFIAFKKPEIKAAKLLGLSLIMIGYLLANGLYIFKRYLLDHDLFSIFDFLLFSFNLSFIVPIIIHTLNYFPLEKQVYIQKKWIIVIPYIVGSIVFLSLIIGFIFFPTIIVISSLINLSVFVSIGLLLYKLIIYLIFRKKLPKEKSNTYLLLKISLLILLLSYIYTQVTVLFFRIQPIFATHLISYIIVFIALIFTIARYNLLDLQLRIRLNIRHSIIVSIWRIFLISIFILFIWVITSNQIEFPNIHLTKSGIEIIDKPLNPLLQTTYEKLSVLLLSSFVFFILWRLNKYVKNILDKRYFKTRFDYRKAANEIYDILTSNLSIRDLAIGLINKLKEQFKLKSVGVIFFRKDEKICGLEHYGFDDDKFLEFCNISGSEIINSIKNLDSAIRIDYLPEIMKTIFKDIGFRFLIPIKSKGEIIGSLLVGEKLSEESLRQEDIEFLTSISGQMFIAIENAFLYEDLAVQDRIKHELEIARKIQLASLPNSIPNIEGLDIAGISLPAYEVGGDFYDFLNGKPNEITVIIGDVSGKGTSAALYMSKVQGIIRTLNEFDNTPKKLLEKTNHLMCKYLEKNFFISAMSAKISLENKNIAIARAGHTPLYYFNSRLNSIEKITGKGMVLGLSKDSLFDESLEETSFHFNKDDIFLFITDGVTDARNKNDMEFGEENLTSILLESHNLDASNIRNKIIKAVKDFSGNTNQFDDMTVVVVKVN